MLRRTLYLLSCRDLALGLLAFAPLQAQDGDTLNVAWPYQVPPTGHFNTFASGGITWGNTWILHEPPLSCLDVGDGRICGHGRRRIWLG